MLLPLLCILLVLQAVAIHIGPGEPSQIHLYDAISPVEQGLWIWAAYVLLIFLATYLSSKCLPERIRFYGTPFLQILSSGLLVWLIPYSKAGPIKLLEWIQNSIHQNFGWHINHELDFVIIWAFLLPFLVAQIIVLVKPGFNRYSSYKKSLGSAIRFLLLLFAPFLLVSPLLGFLPHFLTEPQYQMPLNGALIFTIVSLAPIVLKTLMKTKLLPEGIIRKTLENLAEESQVKYNSLRIWESGPGQINAAVIGSLAPFRYLVITRGMMETFSLSEIKQVFWHEFGHVRHQHMWVYFLFFNILANFGVIVTNLFPEDNIDLTWEFAGATLLFFGIGFSFVSRRLEKQADLFALSHSQEEESYCDVLKKLSSVTGIPYKFYSLTHGSIKQRVSFLEAVIEKPETGINFNRNLRWVVITMIAVFASQWGYWVYKYLL